VRQKIGCVPQGISADLISRKALTRDPELDLERVDVNGGAIAMGHPLGATGCIILGTLLDELERRGLATGCAALCAGAGMGIATVIERV
jgi:acetyl-CoA C-acetyltransferase